MKLLSILKISFSIFFLWSVSLANGQQSSVSRYSPNEIIVKFKPREIDFHKKLPSFNILKNTSKIMENEPVFFKNVKTKNFGLDRICKISLADDSDILQILRELQNNPDIEYAQLNHVYQLDYIPDDPYIAQQWLIEKTQLDEAWEIERGSSDVLVAIIDTGIDYHHEDLGSNLWINVGEDLNRNGQADADDFNNLDDDQNGFVDDLFGWDFTDAPHFPDGGDYLERDNDPLDEHGHGTSVAGIIGAVADNQIGIAGIAHGCRLMNLRAGTSQGLLEEDDVASAIVYAVENGARIINMSFGDVVASPLLHDVMQLAFNHNCVLIASAGNSATSEIHYPSGYNETISVGATTDQDRLASFSNFGVTIDLVAPGVSLFTTKLNNQYGAFSGTSAAAPVVSGIAALILSQQSDLSNEDVRNMLVSSADDIDSAGWDIRYGAGRVNAWKALQINKVSEAKINSPQLDEGFHESPISICGTASGILLDNYQLFYGVGDNPDTWTLIEQVAKRQVIDDNLGQWDFSALPDTSYTIRLRVNNKDGASTVKMTRIFIDRTIPNISNIKTTDMIDGARPSVLIEFKTDDICQASIFYRPQNSSKPFQEIRLNYVTRAHRFNFTTEFGWEKFEFFIAATNKSGLHNQTDILKNENGIDLTKAEIPINQFIQLDYQLPAGYMLNQIVDFDRDGYQEVIINEYGINDSFDKLSIYEFQANEFTKVFQTNQLAIPRDFGDTDGDGLFEILVGMGPKSFIYESPVSGAYPSAIVWADSNEFWASRFSDLDQNGKYEIIGKIENTFELRELVGDHQYALIASFDNPTPGSNHTGIPHTEIADFDGDGLLEILIGDYDGDVYIYEVTGDNSFQSTWWQRQPLMDCINFITAGDYDGDGAAEFAVGCHSSPDLDLEHEYDSRHWSYRIYKSDGDNSFYPVWEQAFFGFEDVKNAANGVSSGDVDNDGRDELLINIFPDFYIIDFDATANQYQSIWYFYPNQSQANIIGDIDNDGKNEFFLNMGDHIIALIDRNENLGVLPPPLGFNAIPLDTNQVQLNWNRVLEADEYLIYKGASATNLVEFHRTVQTNFLDTLVKKDSTYWYTISVVNLGEIGRKTIAISVKPNEKPFVRGAEFITPNQVRIIFSEPMSASIQDVTRYILSGNSGYPSSAIVAKSAQEVIITFSPQNLLEGTYSITVIGVTDIDRTPIDSTRNRASFQITNLIPAPYLIKAEQTGDQTLLLYFSQPLDPNSAIKIENYIIEPDIFVKQAMLDLKDSSIVVLTLDSSFPVVALGQSYTITVKNLKNKFGIPIKSGQGSQVSLVFFKADLSEVLTYPNPCRLTAGQTNIMFANLTREATIKILTSTGEVIREIRETDGNGGVEWDLKDENGELVSSGIYLYYVTSDGHTKIGKLAIVR